MFFSVFAAPDHSPDSRMILILQTIPILFHRFPWQNFEVLPLLENLNYQVALIYHEVFLRSLRIARFRREEFPRDQIELFEPLSKKFYQVVPITRMSQDQFSTLEKPRHGRHPVLHNLLKRSFPWVAHGSNDQKPRINLFLYKVVLIYLLLQLISMDLDFRNVSSPVLLKVENDTNNGVLAIRFIIGLDFDVTRLSSWILLRSLRH